MSSSTAPSAPMNAAKFQDFLDTIENKWNNMLKADYMEKLSPILNKEEYEINKIVMLGIGNPPNLHHLAMLLALRDYFKRDTEIEMVCQEQVNPNSKKYEAFMRELRIRQVYAKERDTHKPIADEIDSYTLVFAPNAGTFVMKALCTKSPELYMGISMEQQEAVCRAVPGTLGIDAQIFRENHHDSAKVPEFAFASSPTDPNPLVFYRRTNGLLNGKDANPNQAAWKNTGFLWTVRRFPLSGWCLNLFANYWLELTLSQVLKTHSYYHLCSFSFFP